METPYLGENCSKKTCNKLKFLPVKCDACFKIYCNDHFSYDSHNCTSTYQNDVQVPVCPLCDFTIPVPRGEFPDVTVGAHIDSDCGSDTAKNRRRRRKKRRVIHFKRHQQDGRTTVYQGSIILQLTV